MNSIWKNIEESFKILGTNLLYAIALIILSVVIIKLIMLITKHILYKAKLRRIVIKFILSIIRITLIIVATITIATKMGIPSTNFVAVTTALSLGISFAIRDMLTNTASGLMLLYSKPFKEGDFLDIGGGIQGTVKSMDITRTNLITQGNQVISVPNSKLTTNNIINFNSKSTRRIEITLTLPLGTDYNKINKKLNEIENINIKSKKAIKSFSQNNFKVTDINTSEITMIYYIWTNTDNYDETKNIVLKQIYDEILMKKDLYKIEMGVNQ